MNSGSIFFDLRKKKWEVFVQNLLLRDCHFSFPSLLTLLWPLQAIQRCKKKSGSVETAAGSWPTVLQVILAMSTPSALLLYRRRQQRSEFLWRGPLAGVRNVEPTAGFWTRSQYTHFLSVSAQTRVQSGGYLRLMFVVWQVLMSFFCLITSRSGRYGGWMLPWSEREIRHYDNNNI